MNISQERDWRFYTFGSILLIFLLAFQLIIELGGTSHGESNCFLLLYNFTPNLLKTVFDPLRTDWNLYQSRELSYFIDAIDARFIGWCIRNKMAHFYSLSAVVAAILTVVIQQWGFAKGFPKLNCYAGLVISVIWLWTPCNFEHHFFRSGKPLTALGITCLLFSVKVLCECNEKKTKSIAAVLSGLAVLLTPMVDRQGLFLIAASGCFFALATMFYPADDRKKSVFKLLACGCVFSVALQTLLNTVITPAIINALNGYTPSFEYQNMPVTAVFDFSGMIHFLVGNIGFWFTGYDSAGVIVSCLIIVVLWQLCRSKKYFTAFAGVYAFAVLTAMANLMMFRHRLLILDGVMHSTYFMPFAAVIIFMIALWAENYEWKKSFAVLCIAGVAVVVSQLTFTVFDNGDPVHNRFHRHATPEIIRCLNDSTIDHRTIPMPYASWKLIDAFRGNLTGWELGGCPIKFPKRR